MKQRKHRGRPSRRRRSGEWYALTAFCVALMAIALAFAIYIGHWYIARGRIRAQSDRYAGLYAGRTGDAAEATDAPTPVITEAPTPMVTEAPTPVITEASTPMVTEAPTPVVTEAPTPVVTEAPTSIITKAPKPVVTEAPTPVITEAPTPIVSEAPTPVVTEAPTPVATEAPTPVVTAVARGADMPVVQDRPISTPNGDTLVIAMPTAPPVQPGFEDLLALNPETVGFLDIEGMLSLPVVQRENNNEYYLNHSFEGEETQEGTLFLDGLNRLVPEDDCLIVYGHNMKNSTMFGKLSAFGDLTYLRQHPVLRFDTLYDNRSYVAFAAFTASMEPGNPRYFDVRQFIFDEAEFDKFVLKLTGRSRFRIPVDVRYGDRLLLLVTCDYSSREGRFILALRQLREDETEASAWAQAMQAEAK